MNDSCDIVLHLLELVDGAEWTSVEHNVAVVDLDRIRLHATRSVVSRWQMWHF